MGKSYLFPYEKVTAHSKVVIYAFGKVGISYANQICVNHYCEIMAIIDRNYKKKVCRDFPIYGMDYLKQNTAYDYLIIAQRDDSIRNAIFDKLVDLGVDQQKIINAAPMEIADRCEKVLSPDLHNLQEIVKGVELDLEFHFEYYADVINDIITIHEDSPCLLDVFKNRLSECTVPEEKMVLLQLFYAAGVFDNTLMRVYLHTIMELDDVDWKYNFFRLSTHMVFFNPEYLYDDFYLERRRVMREISGEIGFHMPIKKLRRNTSGRRKRIAILALCLIDNRMGAHFLTISYANMMQAHGYEVAVFSDEKSCDFLYMTCRCGKRALVPTFYTVNAACYNSCHPRNYDPNVKLVYTDNMSRSVCAQRAAREIEEFDPDCIIDMSDDLSVLSAVLYGRYPIFQIPLRGYTTSSFCDKFLARDRENSLEANQKYLAVQENQMCFHEGVFFKFETKTEYHREEHGLGESDFILTTVGNRLATEVTAEFIESIALLLRANPDMRWILVGENLPDCLDTEYQDLLECGQIVKWGFEKDLLAFYRMCDVFVNPDRAGAGLAIAMAMLCEVPIAATNRVVNDAWPLFGQFITAGNYTEMMDYVMRLKKDEAFYRSVRKQGLHLIQKLMDDEQEENFISAVEDLIAHWYPA